MANPDANDIGLNNMLKSWLRQSATPPPGTRALLRPTAVACAVGCAASALAVTVALAGEGGARHPLPAALDHPVPEANVNVDIDWADDWDDTFASNMARWREQSSEAIAEDEAAIRFAERLREYQLLSRLIERFDAEPQRKLEALYRMAELAHALAPDQDVAVGLLHRAWDLADGDARERWAVLRRMHASINDGMLTADRWRQSVGERALALHERGESEDERELFEMLSEWRSSAEANRRYDEAARAIDAMASLGAGERAQAARRRGQLLARLGAFDAALAQWRQAETMLAEWQAAGDADARAGHERNALRRLIDAHKDAPHRAQPATLSLAGAMNDWLSQHREAGRLPDPAKLDDMVGQATDETGVVADSERTWRSAWSAVAALLDAQPAEALAGLRAHQDELARRAGMPAPDASDAALLRFYRRYAWSSAGEKAMLIFAERSLRRGAAGLAARSFRDVERRSPDAVTRAAARRGLAAAASMQEAVGRPASTEDDLDIAIKPMPLAGLWPSEAMRGDPAEHLAVMERGADLVTDGRAGYFATPTALLRFDADGSIRWRRDAFSDSARPVPGASPMVVPGPFRPWVADGRVFTRWGLTEQGRLTRYVAAFDAETGSMLWTTQDDPDWYGSERDGVGRASQMLWPTSDPVVADGRVYLLAVQHAAGHRVWFAPVMLLCLDADNGRLLWQRRLGANMLPIAHVDGRPNLIHYGHRVLVSEGAVYASTNLGMVARVDGRDGTLDWLYRYERTSRGGTALSARQGGGPQRFGDVIVVSPRDRFGVLALDTATGQRRWSRHTVSAVGVAGVDESRIVFYDDHWLSALDAETGEVAWHHRLAGRRRGAPVQHGDAICLVVDDRLERVAIATGRLLATHKRDGLVEARLVGVVGSTLLVLANLEPPSPDELAAHRVVDASQGELDWPLGHLATLPRSRPTLWRPEGRADLDDRLYLFSDGLLECLDPDAPGLVAWREHVPPGLGAPYWHGRTIVLSYPRKLLALDGHTGKRRWELPLPFNGGNRSQRGQYLLIGDRSAAHRVLMVDLDRGQIAWSHAVHARRRMAVLPQWSGLDADGRQVHLLGRGDGGASGTTGHLLSFEPGTGRLLRELRLAADDATARPLRAVVRDSEMIFVTSDNTFHRTRLGDERPAVELVAIEQKVNLLPHPRRTRLRLHGDRWVELRRDYRGHQLHTFAQWILDADNPDGGLLYVRTYKSFLVGDHLIAHEDRSESTLTEYDLATHRVVRRYEMALPSNAHRPLDVIDVQTAPDRLLVFSVPRSEGYPRHSVWVSVFNRADGELLHQQALGAVPATRADSNTHGNAFALRGGLLLVTSRDGLHLLHHADRERPQLDVPYHADAMPTNASDAARGDAATPHRLPLLQGPGEAELYATHDGERLHLRLSLPRDAIELGVGMGRFGGGDRLDLALSTNVGDHRFELKVDADRRLRTRRLTGNRDDDVIKYAAVLHDPLDDRLVWRLTLDVAGLSDTRWRSWQNPRLALTAWGVAGDQPQRPLVRFGDGIRGTRVTRQAMYELQLLDESPSQ